MNERGVYTSSHPRVKRQGLFTRTVNVTVFLPFKNAIHMQSHNVKKIKDAAYKYGDTDGTCK